MPLPQQPMPHYLKDSLDLVIESTAQKEGPVTEADLNKVAVAAQVQAGIDKYRKQIAAKSTDELIFEEHISTRLAAHLIEAYGARPPRCHAHAMVAGKHQLAATLRLMMAKLKIGIDDTDNGCWLPENTAATPHPAFPKAPPHSRIHRYNYYWWINTRLRPIQMESRFRQTLRLISRMLQTGQMPEYVMLKKGAGLPGENRK
jgi:hypothetical protein